MTCKASSNNACCHAQQRGTSTYRCLLPAWAEAVSCSPGAAGVGAFLGFGLARKLGSTTIALAANNAAALLRACLIAERLMNRGGLRCELSIPDAPLTARCTQVK